MSDFRDFINKVIRKGDTDEARRRWQPQYKSQRLYGGWTALHWACHYTSGDKGGLVKVLVSHGCNIEAQSDYGRWRPLHVCAINGSLEAMRVLMEAGCSLSPFDKDLETPLMLADRKGYHECASLLRSSIEIETFDYAPWKELDWLKNNSLSKIFESETGRALDIILGGNNAKVFEVIKAKPVDKQEIQDWKSLRQSSLNSQSLQWLQECLMYRCIHQNNVDGVYDLCAVDVVNKDSLFSGPTALETAVDCESEIWVREILKKLIKPDESWLRAQNMAKKNQSSLELLIYERMDYLKSKENIGLSRLDVAVIEDDPDTVQYILNTIGNNKDKVHKNLGSALSLAYHINQKRCIETLQANNVNVNTVDRFLQTPLHVAISNKIEEHCDYHLDNTEDFYQRDIFNLTVLTQSVLNDCREVCDNLVWKGVALENYLHISLPLLDSIRISPHPKIEIFQVTSRETIYTLCLKVNGTIYPSLLDTLDLQSVNNSDKNHNTLLHLAAVPLLPDLCNHFMMKSAAVNCINDNGRTPLMELLVHNLEGPMFETMADVIETVNVLIEGGASVNVQDRKGSSVLEMATSYHNEGLLLALVHKNERIDIIKKPLLMAWIHEKYYTLLIAIIPLINQPLLTEWVTPDLIKDVLNESEFHLAQVMCDHASPDVRSEVVETLLYMATKVGDNDLFEGDVNEDISLNSFLDGGDSLLSRLIKERKLNFIEKLLRSRNAIWFIEKKNMELKLPLHVAIESEYWCVMENLISETISVNEEDLDGNTPLSLLLTKISNIEDEVMVSRILAYVKWLVNKSADIYLVNKFRKTVITFCTKSDLKMEIELFFRRQHDQINVASHASSSQAAPAVDTPSQRVCPICDDEPVNCAFNCGHVLCWNCSEKTINCYFCRQRITNRIKLFM